MRDAFRRGWVGLKDGRREGGKEGREAKARGMASFLREGRNTRGEGKSLCLLKARDGPEGGGEEGRGAEGRKESKGRRSSLGGSSSSRKRAGMSPLSNGLPCSRHSPG